jgi:hypothetical protein
VRVHRAQDVPLTVYHDALSPPTRYTPRARNCVGGVARRSAATHHPSRLQSRGGCSTMFGCHSPPPHAPNHVGGVYHNVRLPLTTPSRSQLRGGCTATLGHHLGHPSRLQSCAGCTSAHHPPPAPLALTSTWGVYSPTLGPTPPPAPSCSQLHGGVYHNALPVHCLI